MKSLNEDIKSGQFRNSYLLYGEEAYLKKMYRERLTKALLPDGDTMNYAYYEGKNVNVKEVIDLAETMPFFAERRLIVLEDAGMFKGAASDLADYIKEAPETTYFLFLEKEVDKRSKMYKSVKARGRAVELPFQDENTLKRWILGFVKKEDKQITEKTLNHFLNKVGTDMINIEKELEKVFCYTMDKREITVEDIDAVCITQITNHIFDMVNAIADGNQKKALNLYYDLLALREPPLRILYLMTRQFRMLLQVKDLQEMGYAQKEIAAKAGMHPYAVKKCMGQTGRFQTSKLREILEESAEMEEAVKTGRLAERLSVELFIVKYGSHARA